MAPSRSWPSLGELAAALFVPDFVLPEQSARERELDLTGEQRLALAIVQLTAKDIRQGIGKHFDGAKAWLAERGHSRLPLGLIAALLGTDESIVRCWCLDRRVKLSRGRTAGKQKRMGR